MKIGIQNSIFFELLGTKQEVEKSKKDERYLHYISASMGTIIRVF